jgi:hypothetical protein
MREEPHTMRDAAYYYMPLFKPGASVMHGGRYETVSHVVVRRSALMVYLQGRDIPVHPESLKLEPTAFCLTRRPDKY